MKDYVDVDERLPIGKSIPLSFQHLFAMMGATILVPMLTGLNPSIALFGSGIGTIIYILCTKGRIPAYVGSSFAFIAPMQLATAKYGVNAMLFGLIGAGLVYVVVALIIKFAGVDWLNKLLPPVVVGSVVIVIGLGLAGTAINWAGLNPAYFAEGNLPEALLSISTGKWVIVALVTLITGIIGNAYFKGFFGVIPILVAMITGYIVALIIGVVPAEYIQAIKDAPWFALPHFTFPEVNLNSMILMMPVAFVTLAEHIGHVYVTNNVIGRDFTKDPGLHRSILGDGLATVFAGLIGAPPNTTYGENIGVMALTKIYSIWVIGGAAVLAVLLSFVGKFTTIIQYVPQPVMGGVSILLFGIIASSGFRIFVEEKLDFGKKRNLIIASVVIVLGIGGAKLVIPFGESSFEIANVALATMAGIILNLVIPEKAEKVDKK
ncbi:uracil permease [Clostridium collagenovorans DSM 3089]|uniref:Uracil permease n=1 Tax=Clostridium collagenovorans DSM 3089 TaxID=1121306 RepID=A0A1M5T241_9CLOT|nr:uracil permease [Clostridium collagenovorans]SHH44738.1 uracil permease [Clostridium collagenovorans DSM 3089]